MTLNTRKSAAVLASACSYVLSTACVPSPPIGHVVQGPQHPGKVIVSAQGGGGGATRVGPAAGGAAQVEPFATSRLSVPVTVSYTRLWHTEREPDDEYRPDWFAAGRVGLRYRLGNHFSVGGGVGGGVHQGRDVDLDNRGRRQRLTGGAALIDFEWSTGKRVGPTAVSFAQRLAWDVTVISAVHLISEFGVARYFAGDRVALTLSAFLGWTLPGPLWGGLTAGVALHF